MDYEVIRFLVNFRIVLERKDSTKTFRMAVDNVVIRKGRKASKQKVSIIIELNGF